MELSVAAIPDQWATTRSETVWTLPSAECLGCASVRECHMRETRFHCERRLDE